MPFTGLPRTPWPISFSGKLTLTQRLVTKMFIKEFCWDIIGGGREEAGEGRGKSRQSTNYIRSKGLSQL